MLVRSTENVKFFQEVTKENGKETHEQCVRFMFHKYLRKEDILFEIGSIGTTFYVILKGTVGVWVKIPKETVIIKPDGSEERKTELVPTEVKIMTGGDAYF
jgi:signal-transduction protein with cAMP-binding, CBS, and nucleotidyltransferase domain